MYSPDQLIYAQPVDIKPVGRPIASIPIRGPPRAYGPPKPMPHLSRPLKTPPKRVGYGGNTRPGFSDKYGVASNNFQFSQSSGSFNGHETNFVTRPPFVNEAPYAFDNSKPNYNKVPPSSNTGIKSDTIVQQHVHHHFVHSEAEKDPKIIIKPVAIPVGSIGHLQSSQQQTYGQQSDIITAGEADFSGISSGGFKPMTGSFVKPVYEGDTIYGSQYGHSSFNKEGAGVLSQSLPNHYQSNAFDDQQKYGNSLGAYASQNSEFYKKELNVGSANSLYSQGPATFAQNGVYQENYHEGKQQNFDCVCVNYDQCPSQEIIGRRDDLYLPIDPRNKGSEITALTEDQLDNITKSDALEKETTSAQNSTETETKKISKRETKETKEEGTKEIEPVSKK
jgi:hypothetical protein